jgi:hypothetical protein
MKQTLRRMRKALRLLNGTDFKSTDIAGKYCSYAVPRNRDRRDMNAFTRIFEAPDPAMTRFYVSIQNDQESLYII